MSLNMSFTGSANGFESPQVRISNTFKSTLNFGESEEKRSAPMSKPVHKLSSTKKFNAYGARESERNTMNNVISKSSSAAILFRTPSANLAAPVTRKSY